MPPGFTIKKMFDIAELLLPVFGNSLQFHVPQWSEDKMIQYAHLGPCA